MANDSETERAQRDPSEHTGGARREVPAWVALLVFLALAWVPLAGALTDPGGRTLLAVDTVTSQLPWSAHLAEQGLDARVANAELSDQGTVFYPYYRWVVRSWLGGDPPLWNPHVFLGAPAVGNPQAGVFDPQVWTLVAFEWLFGESGFRFALALLAWLRLALGAFGAFVLARRLGLRRGAPWVAGLAFGFSGFTVLWLGHPLGHVPAFLPWMLVACEALVRARSRGASGIGAGAALALLTAGCVLAGHPETSFYVCAFVGLWCAVGLVRARGDAVVRAAAGYAIAALVLGAALAGPMLVPFVEYLGHSAAKLVREGQVPTIGDVDGVAVLAFAALAGVWFATRAPVGKSSTAVAAGPRVDARWLPRALVLAGATVVLALRGLPEGAVLAFAPGWFGRPDAPGGYLGPGSYLEEASLFAPLAFAALALASCLRGRGPLAGRGVFVVGLALAWWLAQRAPGLLELKRLVPGVGLGATVRLAPVAALCLALLAAEAWQVGLRRERVVGALGVLFVALAVGPFGRWVRSEGPANFAPQRSDAVGLAVRPDARVVGRRIDVEGWFDPARVERVSLRFVAIGAPTQSSPSSLAPPIAFESFDAPSAAARERVESGAVALPAELDGGAVRWFRSPYLDASRLAPGWWTVQLVLRPREGGTPVATALDVAVFEVVRPRRVSAGLVLGLVLLALVPLAAGRTLLGVLVLVGVAVRLVLFAQGQNPAIDVRRAFPETRTERILAEAPPGARFLGGPAVLPPNSAMVRGLYSLRGYDGMQPASYYNFVPYLVQPGVHPLLGWNARGANLASPLLRLCGVHHVALAEPLAAPGWTLIAGPTAAAPRRAEVFVYRADDPLPRVVCVDRVVSLDELVDALRSPAGFDPLRTASADVDWRPTEPFTRADVGTPRFSNTTVEVDVELDGDGLLVLGELMFPGWEAEVDGEVRELVLANAVFRGLPLEAGSHRVRFVYRPASLRAGVALAVLSAGLLLLVGVAARRRRVGSRA